MSEIVLHQSDDGRLLHARRGDVIVVELEENLATGHSWDLQAPGFLDLSDSAHEPGAAPRLGAAGIRRFRLVATADGDGVIEIRLRRPWDPPDAIARKITVQLSVS